MLGSGWKCRGPAGPPQASDLQILDEAEAVKTFAGLGQRPKRRVVPKGKQKGQVAQALYLLKKG